MNNQIENLLDTLDVSSKWTELALSNIEKLVSLNVAQAQKSIALSGLQVKDVATLSSRIPAVWEEVTQTRVRGAVDLARDAAIATLDYQTETRRYIQAHTDAVQKLISASFAKQFSSMPLGDDPEKKP